jgi:hypothetical protein
VASLTLQSLPPPHRKKPKTDREITFLAYLPYFEKKKRLMRSSSLYPHHLKARTVEPEETPVAKQWLSKYVPVAANTRATIERLLDMMFSMQSVSYQILNM